MTDNTNANVVIAFPTERIVRKPTSIPTDTKNVQKEYINGIVNDNAMILISRLAMAGIDISIDDFQKRYALVVECIRAITYDTFGIFHPLQEPITELIRAIESIPVKKD